MARWNYNLQLHISLFYTMRITGLSIIAAVLASTVCAKPTPPSPAIRGHSLQVLPSNNSTAKATSNTKLKARSSSNSFSVSAPKFVTYIDNTVSNRKVKSVMS
jgi:hypothetical protein